jgi:putative oxidoreductase
MPYGARENLFSRFPQTLAQHSEMNSPDNRNRVGVALLVLRVTIFLVMLIWTIDKFVRPSHAISVYEHFYFLRGLGPAIIYSIGLAELVLLIGFVIGFAPRVTYGLVMLLHAVSTFSSFRQYLHPFEGPNILFFAAWPMLGACFTLYYLRDLDTIFRLGSSSRSGTR